MMITKSKVLKTVLLPEYIPRIKNLFSASFSNVAYLIATVYNMVRILPNNHPYLQSSNIGKYSIFQVVKVAANQISYKKENIDQIIIFFTILIALAILLVQFLLLFFVFAIPKSFAQASFPTTIAGFFTVPVENQDKDLAFNILDMVFGLPDFFGPTNEYKEPFHDALLALFSFYSYGMLIVGSFILIYLTATTVMETAQSGIPFGKRFNKTWVPVRILLFFALLLPTTQGLGLNPAQYITLMSAKLGSGLATNGWQLYNDEMSAGQRIADGADAGEGYTLTGRRDQNVAIPTKSDMLHIPKMMSIVRTCKFAYDAIYNKVDNVSPAWEQGIQGFAVYKIKSTDGSAAQYNSINIGNTLGVIRAKQQAWGNDISITFGIRDTERFSNYNGNVNPICGTFEMPTTDVSQPGGQIFRGGYLELLLKLWWYGEVSIADTVDAVTGTVTQEGYTLNIDEYAKYWVSFMSIPDLDPGAGVPPPKSWKSKWEIYMNDLMGDGINDNGLIAQAVRAQLGSSSWGVPAEFEHLGWAGGGIWYNTIAEQNGALIAALRNTPTVLLQPRITEQITAAKRRADLQANINGAGKNDISDSSVPIITDEAEKEINRALSTAAEYWNANPEASQTGNTFIDMINVILGTGGLFEICKNVDIHPLAQLSAVGKSMLDNSIRSFGMSAGFTLFSIAPIFRATSEAVASTFGTIAGIGLMVGFILFYILPFLPFIYFFFAVAGWVKTIFEAMVAMPLWALAHLRIDGDGIVGEAAIKGYFLIFEIFIRPILIMFGLIASLVIFAAMVKVLNQIFYLILANTSGSSMSADAGCFQDAGPLAANQRAEAVEGAYRGPMDEFFFTVLYTIIVYMIGTSCFKLIDQIPSNILRWINADVSTFSDDAGDAAEGLMKYATLGGSQFGSQLGGAVGSIGDGLKQQGQAGVDALGK